MYFLSNKYHLYRKIFKISPNSMINISSAIQDSSLHLKRILPVRIINTFIFDCIKIAMYIWTEWVGSTMISAGGILHHIFLEKARGGASNSDVSNVWNMLFPFWNWLAEGNIIYWELGCFLTNSKNLKFHFITKCFKLMIRFFHSKNNQSNLILMNF